MRLRASAGARPHGYLRHNHFDLFGLRQTWRHFRGLPQEPLPFVTPILYRIVRHPLYVGWLLAFWSTPSDDAHRTCSLRP